MYMFPQSGLGSSFKPMIAIAVPIFDSQGRVAAALSVGSTKQRRTVGELLEEFLPLLHDAAENISSKID